MLACSSICSPLLLCIASLCGKTTSMCPRLRHSHLPLASAPQHLNKQTSPRPALSPLASMIHSSLSWSMVLNAELKSTYSKYRSCWLIFASDMMFITFCSCRIVFFCFLKPSCALLRMLKCSAYLYRHSAITPVHHLYRVFASAMGLQFPKSCSLPFLCRSTF